MYIDTNASADAQNTKLGGLFKLRKQYWLFQVIQGLDALFLGFHFLIITMLAKSVFSAERLPDSYDSLDTIIGALLLILVGPLVDWLGIRKSLIVSFSGLFAIRLLLLIVVLVNPALWGGWLILSLMLISLVFSVIQNSPLENAVIRRYSTPKTRMAGIIAIFLVYIFFATPSNIVAHHLVAKSVLENVSEVWWIFALGLLTAVFSMVFAQRWLKDERQSLQDGEMKALPPKPKFQNILETLRHSTSLHQVFFLALIVSFIDLAGTYWYFIFTQLNLEITTSDTNYGIIIAFCTFLTIFFPFFLLPISHKLKPAKILEWGIILSMLSCLTLPFLVDWVSVVGTILSLTLPEIATSLIMLALTWLAITLAPIGQEGLFTSAIAVGLAIKSILFMVFKLQEKTAENGLENLLSFPGLLLIACSIVALILYFRFKRRLIPEALQNCRAMDAPVE